MNIRRQLDRATFALAGALLSLGFGALRILALLARLGRRPGLREPVKRLLVLAHDPLDQAGTRYRLLAWAERLRARNVRVEVVAPVTPGELRRLYGRGPQRMEVLALLTFVRRLRQVLAASRHDAVLCARAALPRFPWGGPAMERLLTAVQPRWWLDLDDALWAYPPAGRRLGLLAPDPGRTDRAMALARGVLAGNETLAERARRFSNRVSVVPTCVDPDRAPRREHAPAASPVVGWIGTPGNLRHLVSIVPALRRVGAERAIRLRVVSSTPFEVPGIRVENVLWSARSEAAAVASFDVGLMPLEEGPAYEGKCGLKLLQYAAAGVPAVASPVGVNREIVRDGETGFLATTEDEWVAALRVLLGDGDLRARMGAAARADARARWSVDAWEEVVVRALEVGAAGDPA